MRVIKLRVQTVWLTQLAMAERLDARKQNIPLPRKNIFEDGVLDPAAAVKDSLTARIEGGRKCKTKISPISAQ